MPIANGESLCYNIHIKGMDFSAFVWRTGKARIKQEKINAFRYIALGRKTKDEGGKYEKNH